MVRLLLVADELILSTRELVLQQTECKRGLRAEGYKVNGFGYRLWRKREQWNELNPIDRWFGAIATGFISQGFHNRYDSFTIA